MTLSTVVISSSDGGDGVVVVVVVVTIGHPSLLLPSASVLPSGQQPNKLL